MPKSLIDELQHMAQDPSDTPPQAPAPTAGPGLWRSGHRMAIIIAGVSVLSLAAGMGLTRLITDPGQAALDAAPPQAGAITVPVELRELSNQVVLRGDVEPAGAVDVSLQPADTLDVQIVTGQVPQVGDEIAAGDVLVEVSGRPVLALPGVLPAYRSLRAGMQGPDVVQLREALYSLGINTGSVTNDVYDAALAAGVQELFNRAGYTPPAIDQVAQNAVDMAQAEVTAAAQAVADAQNMVNTAGAGASASTVANANNMVNDAARHRDAAISSRDAVLTGCQGPDYALYDCSDAGIIALHNAVASAEEQLYLAVITRDEMLAAPDVSAEVTMLYSAIDRHQEAVTALAQAQAEALTPLPVNEIIFLSYLPRRVDQVMVERGNLVGTASIMSVSAANLEVTSSASAADAALLEVGSVGLITIEGEQVEVTITELLPPEAGAQRWSLVLVPQALTEAQVNFLRGNNVPIVFPLESTGGEVMAVPLAALTAGPGGETRVEVMDAEGVIHLVNVTLGLPSGGFVEIASSETPLNVGDLVVVGHGAGGVQSSDGGGADGSADGPGDDEADG